MTKRADIEPEANGGRALSYTRRCGWIDWGHAGPLNARRLLGAVRSEGRTSARLGQVNVEFTGRNSYLIEFAEQMGAFGARVSSTHHYVIARGLAELEKRSVALSIFLSGSIAFERLQSSLPYSVFMSSGFSAEDLTSNLVGFYAALNGTTLPRMREICGEVSVAESYRIWDAHVPNGLGAIKRRTATPLLFPTKEGVRSKADTTFPPQLTTVPLTPPGEKWAQVAQGLVPDRLIRSGATLTVAKDGRLDVKRPGTIAMPNAGRR